MGDETELGADVPDSNEQEIPIFKGLEAVRQKPGMYIGGTDEKALHFCVWELVEEAIENLTEGDEGITKIDVTLEIDGSITIKRNGDGISTAINPKIGLSFLEWHLTVLHSGYRRLTRGPFKNRIQSIGPKCVNAVSAWFRAEVSIDGKTNTIEFREGETTKPLSEIRSSNGSGVIYSFLPDPKIFKESVVFNAKTIAKMLQEKAALFPSLTLTLINRRAKSPRKKVFHYEDGLSGYLYDLRGSRKGLHPPIRIRAQEPFKYETWGRKETLILAGQVEVDLCFQLTYPGRKEAIKCFTNTWPNPLGGTHLKGLKLGIVQALNLELPDLPDRCLAAVISIYHPVPSFEYSTKDQLASPEVKDLVERKVLEAFTAYLNSENGLAEKIATELRPSKEV